MITYENTKTIRCLLERAEKEYNDATFLRYEHEENVIRDISFNKFARLCRRVGTFVNEMRSREGRQIKVTLFASSSAQSVITLIGVMASGNIAVPLDSRLDITNLIDQLERSDTDILFYDFQYESVIREVKKHCSRIKAYYSLQKAENVHSLYDILENEKYSGKSWSVDDNEFSVCPEDMVMIMFTSGTTGISKGVMHTNGNLIGNYLSSKVISTGDSQPVILNVLPIHHSFCISSEIIGTIVKGGVLAINGPLSLLERHLKMFEPSQMYMVPMIAKALYNKIYALYSDSSLSKEEALHRVYGKNISHITCGGGGLSPELAKNYAELGVYIGQGYGMTECSPIISQQQYERIDKVESVGTVIKHVEVRISDEGEIQVLSPFVMEGYYKEPEMTTEAFTEDGWLKTGDIGYIDDEGFLHIKGRLKNFIILSNGDNVVPEEIELKFMDEPLIEEIIVYGEDDVIKCEVYPNFIYAEENDLEDITAAVEEIIKKHNKSLASYKRIMVINVRKTQFKKTTSKKIIRDAFFKDKKENTEKKEDFRLPETKEQNEVYDICCQCMGHEKFSIDTNLYKVGLDSFSSIMLLTDLNDKLSTSLTITELMDNPTVEQICQKLEEKSQEESIDYSYREVYPLTNLQKYFAYVMRGNTTANIPFFFKLGREVSFDKMEDAIKKLFEVHPILKNRIEPGDDEILYNFRDDDREVNIERLSFTKEEWDDKKEHLVIPYVYEKGDDLYHIGLYEVEGDKYLFFDISHIISDGMTMNILFENLNDLYLGNEVYKSDYTFYEYIIDENVRETTDNREKDIQSFKELLKGHEIKRSILARKDSYDLTTAHSASIQGIFKKLNIENVSLLCKKHGISKNVLFLSAFSYAVRLYASSDDVVISSIHNGRTDGQWAHIAGSLFATYILRYQKVKNETINQLLKSNARQILHTMGIHMSSQRADEMFIQYQGDLLDIPEIGGEPAEGIKLQLHSLPFHLMIYSRNGGFTYELRYWENRFDRDMLEIFLAVMEDIIVAMMKEDVVKRIQSHISPKLYPRYFRISSLQLNEFVGRELIADATDDDILKPYVIDQYGRKKPYGAWGNLFLLNRKVNKDSKAVWSAYSQGVMYDTSIKARITPDNRIETLEQAGRIVLKETLYGRFFIDLYEIEETLMTYPGINSARACMQYGDNNLFCVKTVLETSDEIDEDDVRAFICEKLGEYMIPEIIEFCDNS